MPSTKDAALALAGELIQSITVKETVMMWAVPMLVTFAEGYLEDAFALLISGAFAPTAASRLIVDDISEKWIKNMIRGGSPPQWITQLKKFGVTGFGDDLGPKLQKTWELRHHIIHSAEFDTSVMADMPLRERMNNVGDFVLTTDAFIVNSYHQCVAPA
jgi:hypothetical protein